MASVVHPASEYAELSVQKIGIKQQWTTQELTDLIGGAFLIYKVDRMGQVYRFLVRKESDGLPLNSLAMMLSGYPIQGAVVILRPCERIMAYEAATGEHVEVV